MARTRKAVKYAIVDAFTESKFKGNPAAVCLEEEEEEDQEERDDEALMQSVASEFNVSQTCFLTRIIPASSNSEIPLFRLRWFTPLAQVKLCGHATLAASHLCFTWGLVNGDTIEYSTLSGILTARKVVDPNAAVNNQPFFIELDFPAVISADFHLNDSSLLSQVLNGVSVIHTKKTSTGDILVVLPSAKDVMDFQPQFEEIKQCPGRGLIITALADPNSEYDFVSRFFCPKLGINEDPVCGSAHCALTPFWSKQLGKCDFLAYAASPRSGIVKIHLDEQSNRVKLQGKAVIVMEGVIVV